MDGERAQQLVQVQIDYWRAVGKSNWAEALEQALAKAERCQSMQDVIVDLRQRLEHAERKGNP